MGRKGRPTKPGKRNNAGRLIGEPSQIRGNDRAQLRKEIFATDGWDAIGRAFRMGLLGDGNEAKDRLTIGRRYAAAYHAEWSVGRYSCPLDASPRGGGSEGNNERRERLMTQTARMVATGTAPYFEQLVDPLRMHTDENPSWLGRLIENELANRRLELCGRARIPADERDWIVLRAALMGLDALTAPFRATGDRVRLERVAA